MLALVGGYATMNIAYSFGLKNQVILDVFIIAAGFLLRILAGTLGIGIAPSQWLLVCSLLLTLFLGFTKRRSELLSVTGDFITHRKALLQYNAGAAGQAHRHLRGRGAIMSYSLYTMNPETVRLHGTENLIYTIPFVTTASSATSTCCTRKHAGTDTSRDLVPRPAPAASVLGWVAVTVALIA